VFIEYKNSFQYLLDPITQDYFPGLTVRILKPGSAHTGIDLDVHFDSGASRSLLNGEIIVPALELDLFSGPVQRYLPVSGVGLEGRIHKVEIFHPDLGSFSLDLVSARFRYAGIFSEGIFFNLIQIGFRERHQTLHIRSEP
jgi:hypothetical protein